MTNERDHLYQVQSMRFEMHLSNFCKSSEYENISKAQFLSHSLPLDYAIN